MIIETKFDLGQEVYSPEYSQMLNRHIPVSYRIKEILIQKNQEGNPWVRYGLDLKSGLYREVDLFGSKEEFSQALEEGRV